MNHYQFSDDAQFSYIDIEECMLGLGAAFDNDMLENILLADSNMSLHLNTFQAHGFLVIGDSTVPSEMVIDLSFLNKTDRVSRFLVIMYRMLFKNGGVLITARISNTLNHYGYIQHPDTLRRKQRITRLLE